MGFNIISGIALFFFRIFKKFTKDKFIVSISKNRLIDLKLVKKPEIIWNGAMHPIDKVNYQFADGKPAYLLVEGKGNLDVFKEFEEDQDATDLNSTCIACLQGHENYK